MGKPNAETPPELEAAPHAAPVGSVWVIPARNDVTVTRPDSSTVRVRSNGKAARHTLDLPGVYTVDDQSIEAV